MEGTEKSVLTPPKPGQFSGPACIWAAATKTAATTNDLFIKKHISMG
jgi:hypothetical protein